MTELEKLQEIIDICNHHEGCDRYCSLETQKHCPKLIKHLERREECRKIIFL